MMENIISSPAVCPHCKSFIDSVQVLSPAINAKEDPLILKRILSGEANRITCPRCGERFYFEQGCLVFNFDKSYAVACNGHDLQPPREKSAILRILGKPHIRLRFVKEFMHLIEKVRIFEFDLDDRVLETVKYKYLKVPHNIDDNAKIILDGADGMAMVFGIYDEADRKLCEHRVSIDAYRREYKRFGKETTDSYILQWKKIDINWANTHSKGE